MFRFATPSFALVLGVAALALPLPATGPSGGAGPPDRTGLAAEPAEAFVDTWSVAEIARAARSLPLGGRLHLEGLELGGATEGLDLERFRVFTEDAEIVVHGEEGAETVLPAPDNAYFRGPVVGEPGSLAVLTVRANGEVRGVVRTGDGMYVLGESEPDTDGPTALQARSAAAGEPVPSEGSDGFRCGTGELTTPALPTLAPRQGTVQAAATAASYTARVAIETDWELFQLFGNETDATDYVGDLIAYASGIYDQEIDTDLQIPYLKLWSSSADPWNEGTTLCGFFEFGRYWNDHRTEVDRTIAHFMSGKSNGGGIAWVGVLCQGAFDVDLGSSCSGLSPQIDNYGGGYGYTGNLEGTFDPASPSPVWDIVAVSHEIGHNFNSPHTHCYNGLGGSSEPVDECYSGEGGCYSGSTSLPCDTAGDGCGTLMSYCHAQSGGLSNIGLTFGAGHPYGVQPQRVPDRMRAHADATAQLSTCLDRILPCSPLELSNDTVDTTTLFETDCDLYAGNNFEVTGTSTVTVTLRGARVILEDGFSVTGDASLHVETQ